VNLRRRKVAAQMGLQDITNSLQLNINPVTAKLQDETKRKQALEATVEDLKGVVDSLQVDIEEKDKLLSFASGRTESLACICDGTAKSRRRTLGGLQMKELAAMVERQKVDLGDAEKAADQAAIKDRTAETKLQQFRTTCDPPTNNCNSAKS